MQQKIQCVDHVAILVKEENFQHYVERLSAVLGVTFEEPVVIGNHGMLMTVSWDAGLEIIAPTLKEGSYWERLQRFGEGCVNIVFGVADLDQGIQRARENGAEVPYEAKLDGDEPWLARFEKFREAKVNLFGDDVACALGISELVPVKD